MTVEASAATIGPTCMIDWVWAVAAISAFAHIVCSLSLLMSAGSKLKGGGGEGALSEGKNLTFLSCILTNNTKPKNKNKPKKKIYIYIF